MNTIASLRRQAVSAAKQGDWSQAAQCNQQLLDVSPEDTDALNRLGLAYLQLKKTKDAKATFNKVLDIDRTNVIAKKQIEKLKQNKSLMPAFTSQHFIEEPGRTKTIQLHRLASKSVLQKLTIGQECAFIPKNRYISIEVNGKYIGALPEDLSFRLTKLMQTGNTYTSAVHSVSDKSCKVYVREVSRSAKNRDVQSFPSNKSALQNLSDLNDEQYLFDDDLSIEGVDGDEATDETSEE